MNQNGSQCNSNKLKFLLVYEVNFIPYSNKFLKVITLIGQGME